MIVRHKISLLITAAGFLASLVFSGIILWETIEQPFRIIDSDLQIVARRVVALVAKDGPEGSRQGSSKLDALPVAADDGYWLKIYDQHTGDLIYQSYLAGLVDIPLPAAGSSATVSISVPRDKVDLGQDRGGEVTFRAGNFQVLLDARTFLVRIARPIEKLEEEIWDIVIGVGSGLAFSVLLLMAISYFVAGLILKPIRLMNERAMEIGEKALDQRIPVGAGNDEFNGLARTINGMLDRLQNSFVRQKNLLFDTSHELKTPLTTIRLAIDEIYASRENLPPFTRDTISGLNDQVLRMERLVKDLLTLSALQALDVIHPQAVNVADMLQALVMDYRLMAEARRIHMEVRLAGKLVVNGDAEKLKRAFSNILDNAIKYNVDGGRVDVAGSPSSAGLTVSVTNSGLGIPEAEIDKVFEQFYRVEKSRSGQHGGSGLGLAMVKRIVELHGGQVKLERRQGNCIKVTVHLPGPGHATAL